MTSNIEEFHARCGALFFWGKGMSDRLMSAADLIRVTGMKTSSKQAEWFQSEFGVRVVRCSDGSPIVTWTTFEALLQKRAGLSSANVEPIRPALRPLRSVR